MDKKRIRIGLFFGGKSAEHEVSLISATNVARALDPEKYELVPIGITKWGEWVTGIFPKLLDCPTDPTNIAINAGESRAIRTAVSDGELVSSVSAEAVGRIDVALSLIHGTQGEDGSLPGLFRLAGIPFVGASVLGSAIGFDKDVAKRLLRDAGIPQARFVIARRGEERPSYDELVEVLSSVVFVKPANAGSSVGVHKVIDASSLASALDDAFQYDDKVLIEEAVEGRELECAVLGNDQPKASVVGEVIPSDQHDFYSYESKYLDEHGAKIVIPAPIDTAISERIQTLAIRVFKVLECEGMGRVDVFLRPDGEVLVNEINTIPGFTSVSMYPKLWEASGLSYSALLDELIRLAIERHERQVKVRTDR